MKYAPFGRSGMMVSQYAIGTVTFGGTHGFEKTGSLGPEEGRRLLDIAVDAGVNVIDTANIYSMGDSEKVVSEVIKGRRDQVLLFSKVRTPMGERPNDGGASRVHIMREIDNSLKRLNTDYLDHYWIHQWDGVTPVEETVETMSDLVRAGKIRYWGVSNYSGWQVARTATLAAYSGAIAPIAQQINYTPEAREAEYELIPAAHELGMATQVWSALGEGLLTGKIDREHQAQPGTRQGNDWPEPHIIDKDRLYDVIDVLKEVAGEVGRSVPQVVLAWVRERPGVHSIVLGVRTEDHLHDNLNSLDLTLSAEQTARIERAGRPAAIYPLWHRAMNGTDRPTPIEMGYLEGYRESMRAGK